MSARLGFVGTVLALTTLQAVTSSGNATGRVTGALSGVTNTIRRLSDPDIPAIPDLRKSQKASPGAASPAPMKQPTTRLPVPA